MLWNTLLFYFNSGTTTSSVKVDISVKKNLRSPSGGIIETRKFEKNIPVLFLHFWKFSTSRSN